MAEKPILFSTPMVQAILDGRKTQTRRIIKAPVMRNVREPDSVLFDGKACKFRWFGDDVIGGFEIKPKYQPGDILWIRETWSKDENGEYVYRTNYGTTEDDSFPPSMFKWKPSIHMPREAARIFLRVTNVRVERIQEIAAQDAKEEGIHEPYIASETGYETEMRGQFRDLWDSLNAKRGYGWDSNPWVWVISFEREG